MRVGTAIFLTDQSIAPDVLARHLEDRGLKSLFVPEHTHMPVDHTPYLHGGALPEHYRRTLDPFVSLATAAAATTNLEIGTGICLVAQRDPIVLAKESATLDLLSRGRLTLGVGYGWNAAELATHGVEWKQRRAVVRERVSAIRALWTDEVAKQDTEHVTLPPTWSWPKPSQHPNPPILLGAGLGPRTLADIVDVFDGWMPESEHAVREGLPRLRKAWADAGRAGSPIVRVYGAEADREALERLDALGVTDVNVWLPSAPEREVVSVLDELARVAEAS